MMWLFLQVFTGKEADQTGTKNENKKDRSKAITAESAAEKAAAGEHVQFHCQTIELDSFELCVDGGEGEVCFVLKMSHN